MFNYQMCNLPKNRVTFNVHQTMPVSCDKSRLLWATVHKAKRVPNPKTIKDYVAVFLCFPTKIVHIELVCDLTTGSFLAALKRFFARRKKAVGKANTFIRADRKLRNIHDTFINIITSDILKNNILNNNIM